MSTYYQISTMHPLTCLLFQKEVMTLIEWAGQGKSELHVSEELPWSSHTCQSCGKAASPSCQVHSSSLQRWCHSPVLSEQVPLRLHMRKGSCLIQNVLIWNFPTFLLSGNMEDQLLPKGRELWPMGSKLAGIGLTMQGLWWWGRSTGWDLALWR